MSLINEMLKDLEARGDRTNIARDVHCIADRGRPRMNRALLALCALLALMLAALIYRSHASAHAGARAAETSNGVAVTETAAATEVPEPLRATPDTSVDTTAPIAADTPDKVLPVAQEAAPASRTPATGESRVSEPDAAAKDADATLIVRRHEASDADRRARAARDGFAALQGGDWNVSARLLAELVAIEPANDDAREGLAISLMQTGRVAEVEGVLLDGLAVGTAPARFAKLRARVLASRGDVGGALQGLSVAVPDVADDAEFHALRAALAQRSGDFALAAQTYRRLVAREPANATWQAGLAMALDATGDHTGARDAYQRAMAAGGLDAALRAHVERRLRALQE